MPDTLAASTIPVDSMRLVQPSAPFTTVYGVNNYRMTLRHFQHSACALLLILSAVCVNAYKIQDLLKQLGDPGYMAGIVAVHTGDTKVYEQPVGKASYELNVPMRANMSFPIGSNTKLFTGIAVWQLHKQGKLSVYDPVSKYVKPSDFGLNGTWCPRLTNVTSGPCEVPLVHHLLSMGSGLYDILNCAYLPNSPQLQFCTGTVGSPWETKFTIAQYSNMLAGAMSNKDVLKLLRVFERPLETRPGTAYAYVNVNWVIAGYIVEQVSGMSINQYYKERIFQPAGLTRTFYDLSNGMDGVYKDAVPYPSYIPYVSPINLTMPALDQGVIGNLTFRSGSTFSTSNPYGPPYAKVIKVGANWGSTGLGPAFANLVGPAGAMWSTTGDQHKWFRILLSQPERVGLSQAIIKEMMQLCTPLWVRGVPVLDRQKDFGVDIRFCQGILASLSPKSRFGAVSWYYEGSSGGFQAVNYVEIHPTDASKDVIVNMVVTTVLDKGSVAPFISWDNNSTKKECLWTNPGGVSATPGDRRVPRVLCDSFLPSAMQLSGLQNLITYTAARQWSGKMWWGLRDAAP